MLFAGCRCANVKAGIAVMAGPPGAAFAQECATDKIMLFALEFASPFAGEAGQPDQSSVDGKADRGQPFDGEIAVPGVA